MTSVKKSDKTHRYLTVSRRYIKRAARHNNKIVPQLIIDEHLNSWYVVVTKMYRKKTLVAYRHKNDTPYKHNYTIKKDGWKTAENALRNNNEPVIIEILNNNTKRTREL